MKGIFVIVIYLISHLVLAQSSIDLLTVSYRHSPAKPLDDGMPGTAMERVAFFNAKLPVLLSETDIWYSDFTYQGSFVDFSSDAGQESLALHQLIIQTGWVHRLGETTALQLLLVPRLMSDFQNVDTQHFQFGGIGLYERKFSERLLMRFGGMINSDRFGPMIVPLVYADWRISSRWTFSGLVPIYAKLGYQVNDRLILGISQFGLITSFQMGGAEFAGGYIERKSIDLSIFGRYQVLGNLHLEPRFGYAVGRSYRQFSSGDEVDYRIMIITVGDNRIQENTSFEPGVVFDLRLVYNLSLD